MSNIISLKYYFLCENELVWREFSKKFEISKKRVRVHGHGHGHGFTGAGVTGTGNGYGGPGMHGFIFEKPDPALLIPVPVYPCTRAYPWHGHGPVRARARADRSGLGPWGFYPNTISHWTIFITDRMKFIFWNFDSGYKV